MRLYEIDTFNSKFETVDPSQYMDILKDEVAKGNPRIFRGMRSNDPFITIDASKINRKSAYTSNYYTLLMDILPSWENWPERSKSIPCSTTVSKAAAYGSLYIAIPLENQPIACTKGNVKDFWFAFRNNMKNYHIDGLNEFNEAIDNIQNYASMEANTTTPEKFIKSLKEMKDILKEEKPKISPSDYSDFIHDFVISRNIISFFDKCLNPNKGCALYNSYDEYKQSKQENDEVWLSGKILFVKPSWGNFL